MLTVQADLPREHRLIEIHPFADLHIGDPSCDMESIRKRLAHIEKTDNAYLILNGDLANNATTSSVSDSYTEIYSPNKQIEIIIELFKPYKDRILSIQSGNHELRTYRADGIDLTEIIAARLGLLDKYSMDGTLIELSFGQESKGRKDAAGEIRKVKYRIYATHGNGGGSTAGAKLNRVVKLKENVQADIYIHSHTHTPIVSKVPRAVSENGKTDDCLFINTGASLGYGGYGERAGYAPASLATPTILLDGRERKMHAMI